VNFPLPGIFINDEDGINQPIKVRKKGFFMKKLIEMETEELRQGRLKEERIGFKGFIELEQEKSEKEPEIQKGKLSKRIAVKLVKGK